MTGGRACLGGQAVTAAAAVRVGTQLHPVGVGVHVRGTEGGVALEAAGRDECGVGAHLAACAVGRSQVRSDDGSPLDHEPFGVGLQQQFAAAFDDQSPTGVDVVVGVELVPAAEAEDALCVLGLHADGADPRDAVSEAVHQRALQVTVAARVVPVHDLVARCGPRVTGEACRAADVRGDLDDRDGQAAADGAGAAWSAPPSPHR